MTDPAAIAASLTDAQKAAINAANSILSLKEAK